MRFSSQKSLATLDRAERLRRERAAAPVLRDVSASVTQVSVRLRFLAEEVPSHAEQLFVLYPGARAYFGFPCPYGDCNGIYDLSDAAASALKRADHKTIGTLECLGTRSRHRMPGQSCALQMTYIVTATPT